MHLRALCCAATGLLSLPSTAYAESISQKLEVIGGTIGLFGIVGFFMVMTGMIPMTFYLGFMLVLAGVLIISSGLVWILLAIVGGVVALTLLFWLIGHLVDNHVPNTTNHRSRNKYTSTSMSNLSNPSLSPVINYSNCSREYGLVTKTLWHGTKSINRALDILQGAGTWVVGPGNASGSGVYIASRGTAKGYAGSQGALVKLQLSIHSSQIVYLDDLQADPNFSAWKKSNPGWNAGDAISEYAINRLGRRYLKVSNDIWVALAHQTGGSHYVNFGGLKALGVYDLHGNKIA